MPFRFNWCAKSRTLALLQETCALFCLNCTVSVFCTVHVPHEHWDKGCSPLLSAGRKEIWVKLTNSQKYKHWDRILTTALSKSTCGFYFFIPKRQQRIEFLTNVLCLTLMIKLPVLVSWSDLLKVDIHKRQNPFICEHFFLCGQKNT